jgi:hypothetical protein
MTLHNAILILLVALAIACLTWIYRRDQRRVRGQRGQLFQDCMGLFDRPETRQDGLGYPSLTGFYRGQHFHIDAVIDHIAVRKVPSLWLRVSLLAGLPGMATLDILMRAQNVEFYAPSNDLPYRLDSPAGWPAEAVIHTDDPDRIPPIAVVTPHLDIFRQPQAKEMLITPKGVRLVYQASQGDKLHYQVLRQASFDRPIIAAAQLRDLMDRLIALHEALLAAALASKATPDVDTGVIT